MQDLLTSFINKKENEKEGITIIVSEHVEKFLPYKMIYHEAKRYSNYLNSKGIGIGNELLYQVEDIEQFIYIFWACQLSKVTAVPIDIGENQENNIKVFRIWNKLNNPYYLASECTLEDMDKNKEGERFGVKICHIDKLEETFPSDCKIAILAISENVQETVDRLMKLGIKGIVDFTHSHFMVQEGVEVQTVDVVVAIQELVIKMKSNDQE